MGAPWLYEPFNLSNNKHRILDLCFLVYICLPGTSYASKHSLTGIQPLYWIVAR